MPGILRLSLAAAVLLLAGPAQELRAQQLEGCDVAERGDPPRTIFRCAGGLVIEAEAAAALRLVAEGPDGGPQRVELRGRAVEVEVPLGRRFQILTPHAIASVRGTVYFVDVSAEGTAVFVGEGSVRVGRSDGSDAVVLAPGEGVDVVPGAPLEVRPWGAARVAGLLSRFGR